MNAAKARDFFSAYYEGELKGGILEAFERELAANPGLKAEYDEFCMVLKMFEEPEAEIAMPHDLHDQIMARLDKQAWEEKEAAPQGFFGRWKFALVGAAATFVLVAGVVSLNNRGGDTMQASSIPAMVNQPKIENVVDLVPTDTGLVLQYSGNPGTEYSVVKVADESELGQIRLDTGIATRELVNESDKAEVFAVRAEDGVEMLTVVVPGKVQGDQFIGEGTVLDLAQAMADTFRIPLILRVADLSRTVSWEFEKEGDQASRAAKLEKDGLSLSVRADGVSILSGD